MSGAKEIRLAASLPALGLVDVMLHNESATVLRAFGGDKELARQRQIPHLGVASATFTGVNHSRLEYTLLQCAVIGSVAKLHKGNPALALSNNVNIPGLSERVSSSEELLKSWAILGNAGHAQYTYATERGLISAARTDNAVFAWLTRSTNDTSLRRWTEDVVQRGQDDLLHYVLTLMRIATFPKGDRRKSLCRHLLRALLIPEESLFPTDAEARFKLARLKRVYGLVRLVSILALDSYYSPQPMRLQISQIVMGFPDLLADTGEQEPSFETLLVKTAAWLADALYLHPRVSAIRKSYENKTAVTVLRRFKTAAGARDKLNNLLDNLMRHGIGPPNITDLRPFLRMSFERQPRVAIVPGDFVAAQTQLDRDIASAPNSCVSIDFNPFSRATHVDLLLHKGAQPVAAWGLLRGACKWLVRSAEAQALNDFRRMIPFSERRTSESKTPLRNRLLERSFKRHLSVGPQILQAVMTYFLPEGWSCSISMEGHRDGLRRSVLARMISDGGQVIDLIAPFLEEQLDRNPRGLSADRLHELRGVKALTSRMRGPLVIACVGKIEIRDQMSRSVDELDGIVIELKNDDIKAHFIEAKNLATAHQNERQSFEQLAQTRKHFRQKTPRGFSYKRKILRGIGAALTVNTTTRLEPSPPKP